ncbi:MAG: hypothetical protein ACKVQU_14005 [Burkholderiales bacterium]
MLQKFIVGLASLVVLGAAAGGGWWYAAERGWIAGKPSAPRSENFKRALDEHLRRTTVYYARPCAPVEMTRPQDGMGPTDIRFDWTPAAFRAVIDPRQPQLQHIGARYAFFAAQGYMDAKALADGATEYTLNWKGYAASTGQACFLMAGAERNAEILSFAWKRNENGVDVFEAIARTPHQNFEAWVLTSEFKKIFADQSLQRYLEPQPVAYEFAREERGFEVIAEEGRALTTRMGNAIRPEVLTKLAGGVTAERVRAALDAYLITPDGAARTRICLGLPESGQADENTLDGFRYRGPGGIEQPAPTFTYYNLLTRAPYHGADPLRGFVMMQKLEALGHASAETIPVFAFRDQPVAGAVRFTPSAAFIARYGSERCYPIGTTQVEEIVRFETLTETNLTPPFVARVVIKPFDEEAAKIVAALPHFARMQEVGGVLRGVLQYHDNVLKVVNVTTQYPVFHADVTAVQWPVVEAPLPPGGLFSPTPHAPVGTGANPSGSVRTVPPRVFAIPPR